MRAQHQVCPSPVHQTRVSVRPEPAEPQGEARPAPGSLSSGGGPGETAPHLSPPHAVSLDWLGDSWTPRFPLLTQGVLRPPLFAGHRPSCERAWGTGFPSRSLLLGWPVTKPGVTCGWVRGACPAHRGLKAVPAASHSLRERGRLPDGLQDP